MTRCRRWGAIVAGVLASFLAAAGSKANPSLVVDVDSGNVLYETMATAPWFPASLTKLMTTYVALSAVREGRIKLDTPLRVSSRAAAMAPSKMGFRPGTLVTLDNALKMLMVKSPNDVAVTVAEGVSGSVEAFADEMNRYAAQLGLHESHFVNPNGLPDPSHVSSARDMALIGRALLREFPDEHDLFGIGDLAFGNQIIRNHNGLLGRYPGLDGMKTGYTCSAGYNVVLTAARGGRRLIVVVMGAPSGNTRSERAVGLFDRYFAEAGSSEGQLANLASGAPAAPPDLRSTICGRGRRSAIAEAEAEDAGIAPAAFRPAAAGAVGKSGMIEQAGLAPATTGPNASIMTIPRPYFTPVRVFIGPVDGYTGPIAGPTTRDAGPTEVATAPTPDRARHDAGVLAGADKGPNEAPQPMALLGSTPPLPATLATGNFVRKSKPLSLAVRSRGKRHRLPELAAPPPNGGMTTAVLAGPPSKDEVKAAKPEAKGAKEHRAATPVKPKPKAGAKGAAADKISSK